MSCLHTSLAPLPHFCRSIKEKLAREYVCAFSSFRLLSNEVCTTMYNVKDPCSPLQKSPLRAGGDGGNRGWTMRRSSQSYYVKGCRKKERDSPTSHMPALNDNKLFASMATFAPWWGRGGIVCELGAASASATETGVWDRRRRRRKRGKSPALKAAPAPLARPPPRLIFLRCSQCHVRKKRKIPLSHHLPTTLFRLGKRRKKWGK